MTDEQAAVGHRGRTTPDSFWARVDRTGDCWLWKGCQTKGYGVVARSGRQTYAHRYAHEITHGPIPKGSYVCHRCDQPLCCRPEHLFLGSQTDNMRDAAAKGRVARGERNGQAKLTEDAVREIRARRAAGEKLTDLARQYGVVFGIVSAIAHRRIWRHVA